MPDPMEEIVEAVRKAIIDEWLNSDASIMSDKLAKAALAAIDRDALNVLAAARGCVVVPKDAIPADRATREAYDP